MAAGGGHVRNAERRHEDGPVVVHGERNGSARSVAVEEHHTAGGIAGEFHPGLQGEVGLVTVELHARVGIVHDEVLAGLKLNRACLRPCPRVHRSRTSGDWRGRPGRPTGCSQCRSPGCRCPRRIRSQGGEWQRRRWWAGTATPRCSSVKPRSLGVLVLMVTPGGVVGCLGCGSSCFCGWRPDLGRSTCPRQPGKGDPRLSPRTRLFSLLRTGVLESASPPLIEPAATGTRRVALANTGRKCANDTL